MWRNRHPEALVLPRALAIVAAAVLVGCAADDAAGTWGTDDPHQECAAPGPGWIWCDDFELDRLDAYFEYNGADGAFVRAAGVGVDGSQGMRARYREGAVDAGALHLAFGRTPQRYFRPVDDGSERYGSLYWRFYLKLPTDWVGHGGHKLSRAMVLASPDHWGQAMIAHLWSGGSEGGPGSYLVIDPATGIGASGALSTTTYNDFPNLRWLGLASSSTPFFEESVRGQWSCIEAGVTLNDPGQSNGVFQLWVDGALEAERTGLDWVGSFQEYGVNALFIENYWDEGAPVTQERYIDNLVVSTERIGCAPTPAGERTVP